MTEKYTQSQVIKLRTALAEKLEALMEDYGGEGIADDLLENNFISDEAFTRLAEDGKF